MCGRTKGIPTFILDEKETFYLDLQEDTKTVLKLVWSGIWYIKNLTEMEVNKGWRGEGKQKLLRFARISTYSRDWKIGRE